MNKRKPVNITDQLRQAIADSGQSVYAMAKGSGVNHAAILRFNSGERGLTLDSAALLAEYLGLELTPKRQRKGK